MESDAGRYDDALARLGNTVQAASAGKDFGQSFQEQFSVTLEDAEARYVRYLAGTEGNPAVRL